MPDATLPQHVELSEEAARQVSERVLKALQTPGPLRLDLTEEELASYFSFNSSGLPLVDLVIRVNQGQIWFWARIDIWSRPVIHGRLSLTCDEGKIQIRLDQTWLSGRRLPRFLLASIEKAANDALSDIQLPLQIERIVLDDGIVSVSGTVH